MPYRNTKRRKDGSVYTSPYYKISITTDGKRLQRSTRARTLKEAKRLEAKWKDEIWNQQAFDVEPERSFMEMMFNYLTETAAVKRSHDTDVKRTRNLYGFFGKDFVLNNLSKSHVSEYINSRRDDGVSDKTINKELSLLSTAIKHAQENWEWNLSNPISGKRLEELEGPYRFLSREEAKALIVEAGEGLPVGNGHLPKYLKDFIILGLHTGCRSGELLGLEWNRVDLQNNRIRLEAKHTKSKKARTVPLNRNAREVLLNRQREQARQSMDTPYVFAHTNPRWFGQRIGEIKNAFASACTRAGIEGCTPHTLRHTCASWLVMAGRPLIEVRDLLGHSTVKMTERYAHLAPENLVDAVSSIETRLHYGSTPDDNNKVTGEEHNQVLEFTDENWWARKDSNLRPMDYESTALTN